MKSALLIADPRAALSALSVFNSTPIPSLPSIKILGVHIDSSWSFSNHVASKFKASFLWLFLLFLFRHILLTPHKLLVLSVFEYADTVYIPALTLQLLSRMQRVQHSCLHFSYGARKFDHISPLFALWLDEDQGEVFLHFCYLVFRLLRSNTPPYLRRLLHSNSEFHSISTLVTRYKDCLSLPKHRSSKFQAAISYTAAKYFNDLPSSAHSSFSLFFFRAAPEFIASAKF